MAIVVVAVKMVVVNGLQVQIMWWIMLRDAVCEDTVDVLDVNIPVFMSSCVSDGVYEAGVVVFVVGC